MAEYQVKDCPSSDLKVTWKNQE